MVLARRQHTTGLLSFIVALAAMTLSRSLFLILIIGPSLANAALSPQPQAAADEGGAQRAQDVDSDARRPMIPAGAGGLRKTQEAAAEPKKRIGRFGRRKKNDLSSILFPGASPEEYVDGEEIPMWVEMLESKKTQVPFQYYDLPICEARSTEAKKLRKNLGQKLQGYNLHPSPYAIVARKNIPCQPVCMVKIGSSKLRWLRRLVERQYRIHVKLDGLPVLMRSQELHYAVRGYPVGFKAPPSYTGLKTDEYYLYNHIKFVIRYSEDPDSFEGVRIVGFDAHPVSIAHKNAQGTTELGPNTELVTCNNATTAGNNLETFLPIRAAGVAGEEATKAGGSGENLDVIYSYEVQWEPSATRWADRWDIYMIGSPDDEIHIFSVVNSLMIVVFLTGAVATIMLRTLKRDISSFNELQSLGGGEGGAPEDESGWKLMHGDVFRPPTRFAMLLCVAVGTGAQLATSMAVTLTLAFLGILSPMNKGQTLTSIIILYVLAGSVAGYCSSRLFKFFEAGRKWKRNTLLTATAFPGILVSMFLVLDICLRFAGAATAVSIWTILALFLLWVCVSTPLVFAGSYFGYRAAKIEAPVKTNQIARVVPETTWYTRPPYSVLLGGLLPFGNVCIEVYFIMGALWLHQIYYVMGFLFIVMIILALTCAEISIVMCYLQLCAEDHQWWWRSFLNCASAGFYLFLYSLWFLSTKLDLVGVLPTMVYLTYMSMISMAFALFCGSVGVFSCFWFTKTIYGALKVD